MNSVQKATLEFKWPACEFKRPDFGIQRGNVLKLQIKSLWAKQRQLKQKENVCKSRAKGIIGENWGKILESSEAKPQIWHKAGRPTHDEKRNQKRGA